MESKYKLRVKVFTHTDLDGISTPIIFKKLYDENLISFSFTYVDYTDLNVISDFFDDYKLAAGYDYIFITDINMTQEFYSYKFRKSINDFLYNCKLAKENEDDFIYHFKKIFYIDHHIDSEYTFRKRVNDIFDIIEYYNDMTHCAAFQLFDWIMHQKSTAFQQDVEGFLNPNYNDNESWVRSYVNLVDDWDTFRWKKNHDLKARDLNLLFKEQKRQKFIDAQLRKHSPFFDFYGYEFDVINRINEVIKREFDYALKNSAVRNHVNPTILTEYEELQYLIIKNDNHISLICDMIRDLIYNKHLFPQYNIGYIACISYKNNSISFRRVDEKIDLSKIANWYGGGGHPFAAGCPINMNDKNLVSNFIQPIKKLEVRRELPPNTSKIYKENEIKKGKLHDGLL